MQEHDIYKNYKFTIACVFRERKRKTETNFYPFAKDLIMNEYSVNILRTLTLTALSILGGGNIKERIVNVGKIITFCVVVYCCEETFHEFRR